MTPWRTLLREHTQHLSLSGYADTTIYGRERAVIRLATHMDVVHATRAELMAWRRDLDVSADVIVHYVSHAHAWFAWLIEQGHRSDNPADGVPVPRAGARVHRLPRPIGEGDLFHALETASARVRPWLVLAAWAGLRAKEIALLRREHVLDTADPPVLVIASDATKGHRERTVPLSDFVRVELAPHLRARGYVFRRRDGGRGPNSPHTISHLANAHLHEVGVRATLHQLRHWFGTQTYAATRDLRLVQELLGHARPDTTAGYAAYDRSGASEAVETLPTPRHLRAVH